jgi:predicted Zn-dependent protease
VRSEQAIRVGELLAYRIEIEAGAVRTGGQMTFIAYNDMVYRIDTIARAADAGKYEGRGRAVVRSRRPLTDEEKAEFRITRLQIVTANAGESLEALSLRTKNALPLGTTAVINDLFINSRLDAGQLLKIGVAEPYVPGAPPPRPVEPAPLDKRPPEA